jgi:hypothetical protein
MDHEKLVARVVVSEIFLHVLYVPALITSSSFIRFWNIRNDWKVQQDSYEFAIVLGSLSNFRHVSARIEFSDCCLQSSQIWRWCYKFLF